MKAGSGGVCWHNVRVCVRTESLNPEAIRPWDWKYCSHCGISARQTDLYHDYKMPFIISTRLKARIWCCRFACYCHCSVTKCPLTTGIVASVKGWGARNPLPEITNIYAFRCGKSISTTMELMELIYRKCANIIESYCQVLPLSE